MSGIAAHDPELLPETLLVTIAQAERSTPFPVMLEAILLYFMYELMREAGLRVPKPLGSSVGIVGGLVIGETAVSAGLVSAPSLVVIAVTVITGYTVPKLYEPMAVLRLIFILVGGIWGVWGVLAGFTFFIIRTLRQNKLFRAVFGPGRTISGFPPCGMCLYARGGND